MLFYSLDFHPFFTETCHWALFSMSSILLIIPQHIFIKSVLILSSYLCFYLPSRLAPSISYFKVFHSVHSCSSNTSSVCQPNGHDILNTYFIKSLLHVSVCYTPSSGRTSYYLLKTICFLQCCVLHWLCHRT